MHALNKFDTEIPRLRYGKCYARDDAFKVDTIVTIVYTLVI